MSYKKYGDLAPPVPSKIDNTKNVYNCPVIDSLKFKEKLYNSIPIVVVNCFATWCGPCKRIAPAYSDLAYQLIHRKEIILVKENIEDGYSPDIKGVPTFQFYFLGKKVDIISGGNLDKVKNKIKELYNELMHMNVNHKRQIKKK